MMNGTTQILTSDGVSKLEIDVAVVRIDIPGTLESRQGVLDATLSQTDLPEHELHFGGSRTYANGRFEKCLVRSPLHISRSRSKRHDREAKPETRPK